MKKSLPLLCALVSCLCSSAQDVTVEGLIIPRDNEGMYVRNPDGQFEIEWTKETKVALDKAVRLHEKRRQHEIVEQQKYIKEQKQRLKKLEAEELRKERRRESNKKASVKYRSKKASSVTQVGSTCTPRALARLAHLHA